MAPKEKLTTLGWLKHMQDPNAPYFEWHYLHLIHSFLTEHWWVLQSASDEKALLLLKQVLKVLELDQKAKRDLFLLLQSGPVGRCHGNKILWKVLSGPALDPVYRDLSNLMTSEVYKTRRVFDRPPRGHKDLEWWWWTYYSYPAKKDKRWAPDDLPQGLWYLHMGPGQKPLAPPECWGARPR